MPLSLCRGPFLASIALAVLPSLATAQTSPARIPRDRPDQNPMIAPARQPAPKALPRERNPDAPIAPFQLTQVVIAGSSLGNEELATAYADYIGKQIANAELSAIVDALAERYARSKIALYTVLIPEQRFQQGVLRIVTVEGLINAVEVRGDLRRKRMAPLRAYLRRLQMERPLQTPTLQRVISLIRDIPGFYPDFSFERSDAQGAVKLVVVAKEKPVQVAIGANDRGTALLGRTQLQSDVYLNGLFAGADQFRATLVLPSHVERFQFYGGSYMMPLGNDGATLTGNLSHLRTRPKSIPLKGQATSFGLQFGYPIIRSYARNLHATVGFDGIDSHNALFGDTLSNDRVRAARVAMSYSASTKRNEFWLSATISHGLDLFGARVVAGESRQRFRKLNVKAGDAIKIGKPFLFRLNLFAQATPDRLPSSEQIALGGDEFGRAYEAALIAGDYGYAGSAEFAWRPLGLSKQLDGSELYTFLDGGRVWYRGRFGFPRAESRLASVGLGGRASIAGRALFQLEAARGLNNPVFYKRHEKTRIRFSVRSLF